MSSYPSHSEVLDVLGSKIVAALSDAVRRAEADFEEYRRLHPGWAARHTERTLANLIHSPSIDAGPDAGVSEDRST